MKNNFYKKTHQYIKLNSSKKGIAIVEILTIVAVVSILTITVLPGFSKIRKIQILKSTTEDVISIIEKARSQTLASLDSSNYGVHFESDKIIIFKGTSFSPGNVDNKQINIMSPVTISNCTIIVSCSPSTNGNASLYFNRLTGLPNRSGTLTISAPGISDKIVTISGVGHASVN